MAASFLTNVFLYNISSIWIIFDNIQNIIKGSTHMNANPLTAIDRFQYPNVH